MEEPDGALLQAVFFNCALAGSSGLMPFRARQQKKFLAFPFWPGRCTSTSMLEASASWDLADVKLTAANGSFSATNYRDRCAVANFIVVVARNGVFVWKPKDRGMRITPMSGMDLTRKLYAVHY